MWLQYSCLEDPRGQRSLARSGRVRQDWATKHSTAWMGGDLGGEWTHVYVYLCRFAVQLKLSRHCSLAILQYEIKSSFFDCGFTFTKSYQKIFLQQEWYKIITLCSLTLIPCNGHHHTLSHITGRRSDPGPELLGIK